MAKAPPAAKVVADLKRLKAGKDKGLRFPTVTLLGEGAHARVKHVLPTGMTVLDRWVLGIGGLPWGRMIEVQGQESAGKDTLMDRIIAGAQRDNCVAALLETEHKWDPDWAHKHGVDTESLIFDQPGCLEDAHGLIEELVKRSTPERRHLICLNSIAATPSRKEVDEGATGDVAMGEHARLWSRFCRGIVGLLDAHQATLVLINQIRMKIGVMYGNPETTPGGNAIKHHAQIRLAVGHGKFTDGKTGRQMKITAIKNQACPPFRSGQFLLDFNDGFLDGWSVLNHAKEMHCVPAAERSVKNALEALGWPAPGKDVTVPEASTEVTEVPDGQEES